MRLIIAISLLLQPFIIYSQSSVKDTSRVIDLLELEQRAIGKAFPIFSAENESGKINNDSLKGKVVLINFWFEGCHPCIAEFGGLNELAEKLKSNPDFEFISFARDNDEAIKRVKEKYKLNFPVFQVKAEEARRLNQNTGYPATIILDRNGIIKYLHVGGPSDPDQASDFVINTLLPNIKKELTDETSR